MAIVDVYGLKLNRFAELLNENDKKCEKSQRDIKKESEALKSLIESFFEYLDFIKPLQKIINYTTIIAIVCNSVAIGMAGFIARFYSIPIGVSFLIVFIMEVAVPCVIGEIIKHQNEKMLKEVCLIPWYKLSSKNRRDYLQYLIMCQNLPALETPLIGNLNSELLMNIVMGGYSYLMIILNFTEYQY